MEPDIFKIAAAAIIAAVLSTTIKKDNSVFAIFIAIAVSVIILLLVMPQLAGVLSLLRQIADQVDTNHTYILTVFKIIGIAYIAEFGAQICADAGEGAIASKVELSGKILIMAVSAPIVISMLEQVTSLLP